MDINLVGIVDSVTALAKQRDEALAKYDELQEAARALVSDLEDLDGEAITVCSITGCDALALRGLCYGCNTRDLCDEHAQQFETGPEAERPLDAYDLSYAPALRRLRALLAG